MLAIGVGSGNNYAYLIVDDKSKDAVIIDPAHPEECVFALEQDEKRWLIRNRVAPVLEQQIDGGKINLTAIVNTHQCVVPISTKRIILTIHSHGDHAGGNGKIVGFISSLIFWGVKYWYYANRPAHSTWNQYWVERTAKALPRPRGMERYSKLEIYQWKHCIHLAIRRTVFAGSSRIIQAEQFLLEIRSSTGVCYWFASNDLCADTFDSRMWKVFRGYGWRDAHGFE
jgi:hypothetical protein